MNTILEKAKFLLNDLGVGSVAKPNQLHVNLKELQEMASAFEIKDARAMLMEELHKCVSSKIFIAGNDDNFLFLETF